MFLRISCLIIFLVTGCSSEKYTPYDSSYQRKPTVTESTSPSGDREVVVAPASAPASAPEPKPLPGCPDTVCSDGCKIHFEGGHWSYDLNKDCCLTKNEVLAGIRKTCEKATSTGHFMMACPQPVANWAVQCIRRSLAVTSCECFED